MTESEEFRTPGQLLKALLEQRGWTQGVLSMVIGVDQAVLSKVANDKRPLDAPLALLLGETFDVAPERFLHLQLGYELAKARIEARPDPRRARRAKLLGELPVPEMIKRGWLEVEDAKNIVQVEAALAAFFGANDVDQIDVVPHAAKKTHAADDVTPAQLAWLYRVRQIAEGMVVPRYSTAAMHDAMVKLRTLLAAPEEARQAPRILAEAGVRLVVVESLTGAKIDGACFWLDDRRPVIGMTMRQDRIDNFWFVLRHECEHVLRGDGRATVAFDAELERDRAGTGMQLAEQERLANSAAAEFCVPQKTLKAFVARKAPLFTERDVLALAKMLQIHPGLIAGQLQHATSRYERFRHHLVRVRDAVLPNVMHDGWGDVAPVDLSPRSA